MSHPSTSQPSASRPALSFRAPTLSDEARATQLQEQFLAENFDFAFFTPGESSWADRVAQWQDESQGVNLRPGYVPGSFFWAVVNEEIVGRVSIRHELNEYLLRFGGHIGYAVAPEFRRRGYATEILRQALAFLNDKGVSPVLLTCDEDNIGSRAVIEACGGRLENTVENTEGRATRRYWIG